MENPAHARRARQMIDDFLGAVDDSAPPRTCAACGEENPAAFDVCWNCAASL